jgi:phospholipase/carboxylesterase
LSQNAPRTLQERLFERALSLPGVFAAASLVLPAELAHEVVEKGWGEPHPVSASMTVYGPRDEAELEVVWRLLLASYRFALGEEHEPEEQGS